MHHLPGVNHMWHLLLPLAASVMKVVLLLPFEVLQMMCRISHEVLHEFYKKKTVTSKSLLWRSLKVEDDSQRFEWIRWWLMSPIWALKLQLHTGQMVLVWGLVSGCCCLSFLLLLVFFCDSVGFKCRIPVHQSVLSYVVPSPEADIAFLHAGFEDVLVLSLPTTSQSFPLLELGVEDMLW